MVCVVIGLWLLCGFIVYGFSFGYYQNKWPILSEIEHKKDRGVCLMIGVIGPMGLFCYLLSEGLEGFKYGFKLK